MNYEWDPNKARQNIRNHGIDFFDAIPVLEDPVRLEEIDDRHDYGEVRTRVLGMARDHVLLVVTTMRGDDTCRIISARRATRDEEDRYYEGYGQTR